MPTPPEQPSTNPSGDPLENQPNPSRQSRGKNAPQPPRRQTEQPDSQPPADTTSSPDDSLPTPQEEAISSTRRALERLFTTYPQLMLRAIEYKTDEEWREALDRLMTQYRIDHPEAYPGTEDEVSSYGAWAPSFVRGMDKIRPILHQPESPDSESRPRILMLGAQTPGAATDVMSFTAPFHPSSVTLVDNSPVALDLAAAQEPEINTVKADWYNSDSTQALPDFDIAVGIRVVNMLPQPGDHSPFLTARNNARELATLLGNIAPHMSDRGGMVITLNMPNENGTQEYVRQLYLLQRYLNKQGLIATTFEEVAEFETTPTHDEMAKKQTYTNTDADGHLLNMVRYTHGIMAVIKKLSGETVEEAKQAGIELFDSNHMP